MEKFKTETISAIGWVLSSQLITQVVSFVIGIVLVRLLLPDDFGLIAMIMVFYGLAGILLEVGLGQALIQKKDVKEEHFSSVFWLNFLIGCILGGILFLASGWLSDFYGRAELEDIFKILSINFPIASLVMVHSARFAKELKFQYLQLSEMLAMVVSGIVAIVLATYGYGYWSLVVQRLSQQIVLTTMIWSLSSWSPKFKISFEALKELFIFSSSVFFTQLLRYSYTSMDRLLLGKFMGGSVLGLYDKAYSLMLFPLRNVSSVIGKVMFPALSLIQSDRVRTKKVYLRSIRAIALITYPMMAGLFVVADSFVPSILGEHWVEIIPLLRIFCVAGFISSILTVTGSLYLSQGAAARQFRVSLINTPIRIIGIIAGLPWGGMGVATGFTCSLFISSLITLTVALRLIDLNIFSLVRAIAPILPPTLLMAVSIWGIGLGLTIENKLLLFLLQVVVGVVVYWGLVALMKVEAYTDVTGIIREKFSSSK